MNAMRQQNLILCPKCFSRFPPEKRHLVCRAGDCSRKGMVFPESEVAPHAGPQPVCTDCGREITARLCPHCGFELTGMNSPATPLPISLVGAEGSGKSHYLTVLLNAVKQDMAGPYGSALYPMGGDTTIEQYEREYYEPLFLHGQCIPSTAQERVEPLVYSLTFPENSRVGSTASLTFYDACGANFQSGRDMDEQNRSIYNSKGILLLIDPTQFPPVGERRKAQGLATCDGDPATLLARTIHLIRSGTGREDVRKKIQIPIAVTLSKLDIVLDTLDPSSFVRYRSRHLNQPAFDPVDFESCSLEVQSLIESWGGKELINQITSQFATYGFFAVTALGSEPTPDGKIQHISPHRVMDPFLWLLLQNKIIRAAR